MPGDNIHSAYSNESFSSAGTQTVRGTDGTGDWDKFIKALGLSRPGSAADSGKRIDYVLLTGLEAATASALRVGGQSKDVAVVQAKLGRLRQGSDGPAVAKLRAALGMTPGTSFDAETASKLVDLQHARLGYADAIYSPRMECALSLGVLQRPADCKGQLANAISLLPNPTAKLSGAEPPPRPRDHPALERTTELVAALTRPAATSAHLSTQTLALPANSSSNEVAASLALTGDRLSRFAPKARADYLRAMVQSGDGILARYSINTNSRRLCHFLAQVAHESNGYVISEESPDYGSAARLAQIWPRRFPTTEAAAPFVHNPEALANKIYGGSLGNTQPGDGYRYRGRGLIQITGRATYRDMGRAIGVDLEASPDLAAEGEKAFMIAAGYWNSRANADGQTMNELADANNIAMITRRLNGGLNGLADRRQWFEKCWAIWGEGPQPQSGPAETDDQPAPDAPDPEPTP